MIRALCDKYEAKNKTSLQLGGCTKGLNIDFIDTDKNADLVVYTENWRIHILLNKATTGHKLTADSLQSQSLEVLLTGPV